MSTDSTGDISIKNATVNLVGAAQNLVANNVTIDSGGILDVGTSTVTIVSTSAGAALKVNQGAVINFGTNGTSADGKIVNGGAGPLQVKFQDETKINLAPVSGDIDYWSGKTLIDAGSGGSITDWEKINVGFYALDVDSGKLNVVEKKTFEDVITQATPAALTPNIVAVSGIMQRIAVKASTTPSLIPLVQKLENAVLDIVLEAPSEAAATQAFKQLIGESLVNVNTGVATTVLKTQGVVFNRLDRIREADADFLTPPAAGSGGELNRVWAGGFGVWAEEDNTAVVDGYEYSSGGFALGYDRKIDALPGLRLGLSGSYANGKIDNNDGRTRVDLETVGLGFYGSYTLPNNIFFDASFAYASTNSDYRTNLIVGGEKTGSFDIDSWQFGLRAGYVYRNGSFQLIPSIGVRYVYLEQEAFADSLNAAAAGNTVANSYRARKDHQVDIPIQLTANTTIQAGSISLTPELRLGYTFAAKKLDNAMNVGFVGSAETAEIHGTRSRGGTFQAGAGLKINTGGAVDVFVNYDLDVNSHYRGHKASAGLGFEF